ncbi:MAG: tripartite tricarboxylate transporter TctB family protein [Deltaproteobacteria bacterium]|nr:tripartite tricarboxylate transporter TctB family protein [Deltaproteobacteria bacterium]
MQRYDRLGGLLWMAIGMAIGVESIRLGTGSVSAPGPGLIPLGCGLLLLLLGMVLFIFNYGTTASPPTVCKEQAISWKKLILALGYLAGYALLLEVLGFLLVTVLWVGANCRLGNMNWKKTVAVAVTATLSSFFIFEYCLKIRFPRGSFGF